MRRLPRRAWVLAALSVLLNGPPVASADTITCQTCISLYACDNDIGRCVADCQERYRDQPFSLEICSNDCNRTLDLCVDQANLECARIKKCP